MSFKDHFSKQAVDYAKFRPRYPRALFEFIAAEAPNNESALDVATGNGQAAVALAGFFDQVIAIDASASQIASAEPNERVGYRVAPAEATGLESASCDVVTVAQALHWFDLPAFYQEARRVLRRRGLIAIWAYQHLQVTSEVDAAVWHLYDEIVGPYWPPERKIVEAGYDDLAFPFEELATPEFRIAARWSREHLLGYLRTWSATQRFLQEKGRDPVEEIAPELAKAWGNADERLVIWPLSTRIGRAT